MNLIVAVLLAAAALVASAVEPQQAQQPPQTQQAQPPRVEATDLDRLTGARWSGTLTYLDYRKNTKTSIPSELVVTRDAEASWTFEYLYPREPHANGKKIVALAEQGRTLAGEVVVERAALSDGTVRIVTESDGSDNDRPARFRHTYLLGASSLSIKKEVRGAGVADFFQRNEYSWTR